MSLKAVEMQIAIPRTSNAGEQQHQLLNKPVDDQAQLAATMQRAAQLERQRSAKVEHPADMMINDEDQEHQRRDGENRNFGKKTAGKQGEQAEHPYKGHHIDLSL